MDKSSSYSATAPRSSSSSSLFGSLSTLKLFMVRDDLHYMDTKILQGHVSENLATDTEGSVLRLIKSWDLFTEHYPQKLLNIDSTFEKLLRYTAKAVFHGKFTKTVPDSTKTKLKDAVTSCGFKMEYGSPHMSVCLTFGQIIEEPWTKFVGTLHSSLNSKDMERIWDDEGWILLDERLEILLSTKMIDHAATILEVCIMKGHQWYHSCSEQSFVTSIEFDPFHFSFDKLIQYMIIYVFLWNRSQNKYKAFDLWTSKMFREVIQALRLKDDERNENTRLFPKLKEWKKANKIALPFLETAVWSLLKRENSDLDTLEDLINFWIESVPQEENATEIPIHMKSILDRSKDVSSSAYIYLLGDMVKKNKVGLTDVIARAKFVEIYIRAILLDISTIEVQKSVKEVDKDKVLDVQRKLAEVFVKMADLFNDHRATSFHCLLTAHCLHPQQTLYHRLFPESDTGVVPSEDSYTIPKCIDKPEDLQLTPVLCEDLTTVINTPRWKAICGWTSKEELKNLCHTLLKSGGDSFITEKELEFINVDYDKFKNLKPSVDPDDDGIEKGYGYGEKRKPRRLVGINCLPLVTKMKAGRGRRIVTKLDGLESSKIKTKRRFFKKMTNSLTRTLNRPSISSKNLIRTKLFATKLKNKSRLVSHKDISNNFRRRRPQHSPKKSQLPNFLPSGYQIPPAIVPINILDPSKSDAVTLSQYQHYSSRLTISASERKSEDQIGKPDTTPDLQAFDKIVNESPSRKLSDYRCKRTLEANGTNININSSHLPRLEQADLVNAEQNWRRKLSSNNVRQNNCNPRVELVPEPLLDVEIVKLAKESIGLKYIIQGFKLNPKISIQDLTSSITNVNKTGSDEGDVESSPKVNNTQYYRAGPKSVKTRRQLVLKRKMISDCQERLAYYADSKRRALEYLTQMEDVPVAETIIKSQHELELVTPAETPQLIPPPSNIDGPTATYATHPSEDISEKLVTVVKLETPNLGICISSEVSLQSDPMTSSCMIKAESNNLESSNYPEFLHNSRSPSIPSEIPPDNSAFLEYAETTHFEISPAPGECLGDISAVLDNSVNENSMVCIVEVVGKESSPITNTWDPQESKEPVLDLKKPLLCGQVNSAKKTEIMATSNNSAKKRGSRKSRSLSSSESVMATIDSVVGSTNGFISSCIVNQDVMGYSGCMCNNGFHSINGQRNMSQQTCCCGPDVPSRPEILGNGLCSLDSFPRDVKQSAPDIGNSVDNELSNTILSGMDLTTHEPVGDVAKELQAIIESVPVLKEPFSLPPTDAPVVSLSLISQGMDSQDLLGDSRNVNPNDEDISAMQIIIPDTINKSTAKASSTLQHSDAGTYCDLQKDEEENRLEAPPVSIYTDTAAVAALCDIPKDIEKHNFIKLPIRKIVRQPCVEQTTNHQLMLGNKRMILRILPCDSPIQRHPVPNPRPALHLKNEEANPAGDGSVALVEVMNEDNKMEIRDLVALKPSIVLSKNEENECTKETVQNDDDDIQVLDVVRSVISTVTLGKRRTQTMSHTGEFLKRRRRKHGLGSETTRIVSPSFQMSAGRGRKYKSKHGNGSKLTKKGEDILKVRLVSEPMDSDSCGDNIRYDNVDVGKDEDVKNVIDVKVNCDSSQGDIISENFQDQDKILPAEKGDITLDAIPLETENSREDAGIEPKQLNKKYKSESNEYVSTSPENVLPDPGNADGIPNDISTCFLDTPDEVNQKEISVNDTSATHTENSTENTDTGAFENDTSATHTENSTENTDTGAFENDTSAIHTENSTENTDTGAFENDVETRLNEIENTDIEPNDTIDDESHGKLHDSNSNTDTVECVNLEEEILAEQEESMANHSAIGCSIQTEDSVKNDNVDISNPSPENESSENITEKVYNADQTESSGDDMACINYEDCGTESCTEEIKAGNELSSTHLESESQTLGSNCNMHSIKFENPGDMAQPEIDSGVAEDTSPFPNVTEPEKVDGSSRDFSNAWLNDDSEEVNQNEMSAKGVSANIYTERSTENTDTDTRTSENDVEETHLEELENIDIEPNDTIDDESRIKLLDPNSNVDIVECVSLEDEVSEEQVESVANHSDFGCSMQTEDNVKDCNIYISSPIPENEPFEFVTEKSYNTSHDECSSENMTCIKSEDCVKESCAEETETNNDPSFTPVESQSQQSPGSINSLKSIKLESLDEGTQVEVEIDNGGNGSLNLANCNFKNEIVGSIVEKDEALNESENCSENSLCFESESCGAISDSEKPIIIGEECNDTLVSECSVPEELLTTESCPKKDNTPCSGSSGSESRGSSQSSTNHKKSSFKSRFLFPILEKSTRGKGSPHLINHKERNILRNRLKTLLQTSTEPSKVEANSPLPKNSDTHTENSVNRQIRQKSPESNSDDDCLPHLVHISPLRKRSKASTDEDDSPPTLDRFI